MVVVSGNQAGISRSDRGPNGCLGAVTTHTAVTHSHTVIHSHTHKVIHTVAQSHTHTQSNTPLHSHTLTVKLKLLVIRVPAHHPQVDRWWVVSGVMLMVVLSTGK